MRQKIWRKNFEIKRIDFQMPYSIMESIYKFQTVFLDKPYIKEGIWVNENGDNIGSYFIINELRAQIQATLKKIINNPDAVGRLHKKTTAINAKYFQFSKKVEKLAFKKLSNKQLIEYYYQILDLQTVSHGLSLPTTWFLDSDGEDFSKYLMKQLVACIKKSKSKIEPAIAFSVLTSPLKESMARTEEKELMRLMLKLGKSAGVDKKLIYAHYLRWRWTPYTYNGPCYDLDYYSQTIAGLSREGVDPKKKLLEFNSSLKNTVAEQKKLIKELKISRKLLHLFKTAQEIIYIKSFRKDCLFMGCYARDLILAEIAKRLHITTMQAKSFIPAEVKQVLKTGKCDVNILNNRMKFSVIYMKNGKNTVYLGKDANNFLKKQKFEKIETVESNELVGTCACPGQASGVVKIINLPEEMGKMEQGDIMVSHTTFPSLVPAMKKAAAIITEDGGITCHAAIVSRELHIPCVVGTKIATQALKDGYLVEVDAGHGSVRIIEQLV